MYTRVIAVLCFLLSGASLLRAQAKPTASRTVDLQIGLDYIGGRSDYGQTLKGGGAYATFDLTNHFGGELDFQQADGSLFKVYERTYEVGGRYHRTYGRLEPFVRGSYGRGVFNFPYNEANLAYNLFAVAGGADYNVTRYLSVRGSFEYQHWFSFPPHGLTPEVYTIGVAYHFPGGLRRGEHF